MVSISYCRENMFKHQQELLPPLKNRETRWRFLKVRVEEHVAMMLMLTNTPSANANKHCQLTLTNTLPAETSIIRPQSITAEEAGCDFN